MLNAARQVGGVIGVALLGTLVTQRTSFMPGLRVGMAIAGGAFFTGVILTAAAVEQVRAAQPSA